ncbi:MAG: tetratricopeptide repeat protein [Pseudomonadota bacterium]
MTTAGKTVKQETMLIAIAITFLLGFLTGTIFTVYKLGPSKTTAAQPTNVQEQQGVTLSNEQAQAIAALEAEVAKNHENGESWTRLGNLFYDTHQFKKAINAYTHALALVPANADILTDLGVMYQRDQQADKALEVFDQAIRTNPRHEASRLNKGIVLFSDLGRVTEALQSWQELLNINPDATTANGKSVRDLIAELTKEIDPPEGKKSTENK